MINVSDEFKQLMNVRTDFMENAEVTLVDGTVLNFKEKDFTVSNNSVTDAADTNAMPLGEAIGRSIQIELLNEDDHLSEYDFYGAKIRMYLTFKLSSTTEKIEYGTYTVISPETYGTTVIITASDDMYKADMAYSTNISFPATVKSMLRDICTNCGIRLLTSDFPNSDFIVTNMPSSDYTYRQVIGYIAMIAVGNARVNRQGYLEILPYDLNYTKEHHLLTEWSYLKADVSDITITGIQTTKKVIETVDGKETEREVTVLEGSEGYVLAVDNPLIKGKEQTVVSIIAEKLNGFSFRKFEGDYISYPLAEFMDLVEFSDWKGNTYKSFITDVNFVFFGFTTLKNSAESGLRNGNKYFSKTTDTLVKAKELLSKEKTEREIAVEKLNKTLRESSGMYSTDDQQEDGSVIHYLHDKPTLTESKNVIKTTSEAIGFSNDGGITYPYGFTLNGETIMHIIQTEGVNADWVNTGAITVKDDSGNIIFSVDIDTGKVIISGNTVMIGGKTAITALEEVRQEAENARSLSISLSNDYQGIQTDSDGNYDVIEASTKVTVRYGHTDVSTDCSYNVIKSSGISGTWNLSTRTFSLTGLETDSGWVDITATYLNILVATKRFSVSKVKGGMPGADAKLCTVTGGQVMVYASGSVNPEPESITLLAEYQNATHGKWQYLNEYAVWADFIPVQTNAAITIDDVSVAWVGDTAVIRAVDTDQVAMDTITLAKLRDGKDGKDGEDGAQGPRGLQGLQGEKGDQGIQGAKGADGKSSYTHIAYANSSDGTTDFSLSDSNRTYIGMYVDSTAADSTNPAIYAWSKIKGADGSQGTPGKAGTDGKTPYLHIAYANSADGKTGFSVSDSTDKLYIGQYTDYASADSTDPTKYSWTKIKGDQGPQGVQGPKGTDGKQYYTWLKYADTPTTGMSDDPANKAYIGLAYNKATAAESSNYGDYTWSKIKGEKGDQGVTGGKGADGKTYYTWIKYATSAAGANMSDDPSGKTYIGLAYNKPTSTESTTASDYTWSLIKGDKGDKGDQGAQGIQGPKGTDGKTYYTWLKYADTPTTGMSDSPDGKAYIGLAYNKVSATESNVYSDYTWSKVKGEKGDQGVAGGKGADGKTYYTWVKYATNASGAGMSDDPAGKTYIGLAYNKSTATESTTASDYTWSLIKGDKGDTGTPGIGYTVLLSNEAYAFAAGTTAAVSGSTYTNVIAYKNTTQVVATVSKIGSTTVTGNATGISTGFTGLTAAVTGNGTTSCKITFSVTTALITKNGSVAITITIDGKSFVKEFSFTLSFKGANGASGRTYFIEPSTDILKRSKDNSISPNFVEFKSYYRDGSNATRTTYSGRWIIEETSDGESWTSIYTSSVNENTIKHYLYSMLGDSSGNALANANGDTIGIPRDVVLVRAKLYAAGGTSNLLDMQSVAVVTDVDALSHEEIFNLLTNNGEIKGIYQEGNQLYISFTYAKGGTLTLGGQNNSSGILEIRDMSGNIIGLINNEGSSLTGEFKSLHKYFQYVIETMISNGSFSMKRDDTEFYNVSIEGVKFTDPSLGMLMNVGNSGCKFRNLISIGGANITGYTYINGDTYINGNLTVPSKYSKNKLADTENYGERLLYCYEMTIPVFGDIGSGETDDNGECFIFLDDIFSETVSLDRNYYIFLQKEGKGDLWIELKARNYFVVKGSPNLKFSWEIKARQKNWESERLEIFNRSNEEVEFIESSVKKDEEQERA